LFFDRPPPKNGICSRQGPSDRQDLSSERNARALKKIFPGVYPEPPEGRNGNPLRSFDSLRIAFPRDIRFFSLPLRRALFLPDNGADVEITEPYPLPSIARKKEDSSFPLGNDNRLKRPERFDGDSQVGN
jgi:hypothetical protein